MKEATKDLIVAGCMMLSIIMLVITSAGDRIEIRKDRDTFNESLIGIKDDVSEIKWRTVNTRLDVLDVKEEIMLGHEVDVWVVTYYNKETEHCASRGVFLSELEALAEMSKAKEELGENVILDVRQFNIHP